MNRNCLWTEEEIIDYILGKLETNKIKKLEKHLATCKSCRSIYQYWQEILNGVVDENKQPSASLKKRIFKTISRENRQHLFPLKKPLVWISTIAAVILIIVLTTFSGLHEVNQKNTNQLVDNEEFLLTKDTKVYNVISMKPYNIRGYACINEFDYKVLLFVNGLPPISDRIYQAWIKTPDNLQQAGKIRLFNENGLILLKNINVNDIEYIIISKESSIGTIKPTDPDAIIIQFNVKNRVRALVP
ncbi:MAG: hypothetical protein PWR10_566 [Halanaerobiales bacterium]|nr:hypothetical protein [Halanaerobiales bacterium]